MTRAAVHGLLVGLLCTASAAESRGRPAKLPRIVIAGLAIESSTFSPARTVEEEFHAKTGDALPGGMVTREAYESLLGKMLRMLAAGVPYDGVFFDIHGAMSVEGLDDPEGDMRSSSGWAACTSSSRRGGSPTTTRRTSRTSASIPGGRRSSG